VHGGGGGLCPPDPPAPPLMVEVLGLFTSVARLTIVHQMAPLPSGLGAAVENDVIAAIVDFGPFRFSVIFAPLTLCFGQIK